MVRYIVSIRHFLTLYSVDEAISWRYDAAMYFDFEPNYCCWDELTTPVTPCAPPCWDWDPSFGTQGK